MLQVVKSEPPHADPNDPRLARASSLEYEIREIHRLVMRCEMTLDREVLSTPATWKVESLLLHLRAESEAKIQEADRLRRLVGGGDYGSAA